MYDLPSVYRRNQKYEVNEREMYRPNVQDEHAIELRWCLREGFVEWWRRWRSGESKDH
jgi:hypothetical protein